MKKIALIYGSDTGMTEDITCDIINKWKGPAIEVIEVDKASKETFESYDQLILGLSTWYDGELQSDWELFFDTFQTIDFNNKKVALFGLGDQYGYGDNFIDGVGMLAEVVLKNGGIIIGQWPTEDYDFSASKALISETHFYGLALDEDNEDKLTSERVDNWLEILLKEFKE